MAKADQAPGKGPSGPLPGVVPAYTFLLALTGVAVGVLVSDTVGAAERVPWPHLAVLAGTLAVAGYVELRYQYRHEGASLDLFEAVLATVILVVPGLGAVVLAGAAKAAAELARRIHPRKAAFNIAQWTCATAVGSLVFVHLRPGPGPAPHHIPALVVAMLMLSAANFLALVGVITLD